MTWHFILYLLYGLAFFTLGVAIFSRDIRLSELGIARIIWLLGVFGIVHGFHEWIELLSQLNPALQTAGYNLLRLMVVAISFLFLLYFGLFLNIITFRGDAALKTTPLYIKAAIASAALALIICSTYLDMGSGKDNHLRLLVAFPGALLSGIGLVAYSRTVKSFSETVANNFILAGTFMCCYAVLSGVVSSGTIIPVLGIEVILLRGVSAFLIMLFTIRALSVFNLEQRELIQDKLQRFSQSEKLTSMGILAAGIAHEINNPLTNVRLNLEMLKDLVGEDPRVIKKLDAIDRNVSRASRIAKELLHFSREKETQSKPVELSRIITSSINLVKNHPGSAIITYRHQRTPLIYGIPWKLEEVFINLLMNSLDACELHDTIDITTSEGSSTVSVIIADTGHGIRDKDLGHVFDPFFTTKEIGKGTGLGLSVCYNIVKQHGGEISLTSSETGGTVASVSFPKVDDEQ